MVPTLSPSGRARRHPAPYVVGAGAALVLFAACLVWLLVVVPNGEFGVRSRAPSAGTGTLADQGSGQSTTAKNEAVLPEKSPTGGAGQSANGEAAQIATRERRRSS